MAGLARGLGHHFEISYEPRAFKVPETLKEAKPPQVILVDLCDHAAVTILADLCGSGVPVIGIQPVEGRVTVLTGHAHAIQSIAELLELLQLLNGIS